MDTSETYIKMCDCEEIQDLLPYELKSKMTFKYADNWYPHKNCEYLITIDGIITQEGIWLPRQDQLQEMIDNGWTGDLIRRFYFWGKEYGFQTKAIDSMEQLWLAFVMQERHKKHWDGEKWQHI